MDRVIFIMGVSGSGKSTVGKLLSQELHIPFFDGDDFHSKENISKMSSGKSLNDSDRQNWLKTLNELAKKQLIKTSCIIACSALKQNYRDALSLNIERESKWIHLYGSYDSICRRINARKDHFMSSDLLESQFDTLEEPCNAITVNIELTPNEIVNKIKRRIDE